MSSLPTAVIIHRSAQRLCGGRLLRYYPATASRPPTANVLGPMWADLSLLVFSSAPDAALRSLRASCSSAPCCALSVATAQKPDPLSRTQVSMRPVGESMHSLVLDQEVAPSLGHW
jgi:hypothetical protein